MTHDPDHHEEPAVRPPRVLTGVDSDTSDRANRWWWDQDADNYHAEHGEFLGTFASGGDFVWCPEGLREADIGLLGDTSGRDVLEVGCGSAPCSRWLAAQGARVVGIDISRRMLGIGLAAMDADGVRVPLIQATAESLPFADGSFDVVCSAEREPYGKPHPGIFLRAAAELGAAPTSCVVVEDSITGLVAAKAARMTCVAVPCDHGGDPRFALADAVVPSLDHVTAELLAAISGTGAAPPASPARG